MSDLSPECTPKRTSPSNHFEFMGFRPGLTGRSNTAKRAGAFVASRDFRNPFNAICAVRPELICPTC
jgi:hypothetical protein